MIQHTVVYRLKHPLNSAKEKDFQEAIAGLAKVPGVKHLKRHRQVSPKNKFTFGLSMEFSTMDDYRAYNQHPLHVDFVANRWVPEVAAFMEIDYTSYRKGGTPA
jgi:hypothetical protein